MNREISKSSSRIAPSTKKGKSDIKRKSKDKGSNTIFSFWRTKTSSNVVRATPEVRRSNSISQQDRISALEKELESYKNKCKNLEDEVIGLKDKLKESEETTKKLRNQLLGSSVQV